MDALIFSLIVLLQSVGLVYYQRSAARSRNRADKWRAVALANCEKASGQ